MGPPNYQKARLISETTEWDEQVKRLKLALINLQYFSDNPQQINQWRETSRRELANLMQISQDISNEKMVILEPIILQCLILGFDPMESQQNCCQSTSLAISSTFTRIFSNFRKYQEIKRPR